MFHSALLPSNNFQSHGNSRVLHFMRAKKWCIWYQPHRVGEVVVIKNSTFHRSDLVPRTYCDPTRCYGDLWSVRPSTASSFASRHPHLHAPSWLAWWRPSFSWQSLFDFWRQHQHRLHMFTCWDTSEQTQQSRLWSSGTSKSADSAAVFWNGIVLMSARVSRDCRRRGTQHHRCPHQQVLLFPARSFEEKQSLKGAGMFKIKVFNAYEENEHSHDTCVVLPDKPHWKRALATHGRNTLMISFGRAAW